MSITLDTALDEFITHIDNRRRNKTYRKLELKRVKGLLDSRSGVLENTLEHLSNDSKELEASITSALSSFQKVDKNPLADFYRDFVKHINDNYNLNIAVDIPTNLPHNKFELRILIIKLLQYMPMSADDVAEKAYVTKETASTYLRELSSPDPQKGLFLGGKKVEIVFDRPNNKYSLSETLHPLVLTPNLMQVILLIKGLFTVQNDGYETMTKDTAANIWNQLSEAGQNMIKEKANECNFPLEWVLSVPQKTVVPYRTEIDYIEINRNENILNVPHIIKQRRPMRVIYKEDNNEQMFIFECAWAELTYDKKYMEMQDMAGQSRVIMVASIVDILLGPFQDPQNNDM